MLNELEKNPDLTEEQAFHLRRIREALDDLWIGSATEAVIYAAQAELLSIWDDHDD